jgi:peptide/nickel transport system permease protein
VVSLAVIATLAFAITRLVPGDPARIILGAQHVTAANLATLHRQLGLNGSLFSQYTHFMEGLPTFNFGESIHFRQPVGSVVSPTVMPSLWLILYACLLSVTVAVPLALVAATHRNRLPDHVIRVGSTLGYATPAFLAGVLLILVFSVNLGWFPVEGYGSGFAGRLRSLTLPAVIVSLAFAPFLLRTLRTGMLETLGQDFIESARARGLTSRRVLFKHVLRNSILPALTILGLSIGYLLSAVVIVENVFAIPGMGSLLVSSVSNRDYPVVQALVVIFAGTVVVSSLVTDMLYLVVDPRIRL